MLKVLTSKYNIDNTVYIFKYLVLFFTKLKNERQN